MQTDRDTRGPLIYGLFRADDPEQIVRYVGQTSGNLHSRMGRHRSSGREQAPKTPVAAWIKRHFKVGFDWIVLEYCSSFEDLNLAESYWIFTLETHVSVVNGLNCTEGGQGAPGKVWTDEQRLGIKGEGNHFYGKHHDESTRQHLSQLRLGKKLSPDHAGKISQGNLLSYKDGRRQLEISAFQKEYSNSEVGRVQRRAAFAYAGHVRWHVSRGLVKDGCGHCGTVAGSASSAAHRGAARGGTRGP